MIASYVFLSSLGQEIQTLTTGKSWLLGCKARYAGQPLRRELRREGTRFIQDNRSRVSGQNAVITFQFQIIVFISIWEIEQVL